MEGVNKSDAKIRPVDQRLDFCHYWLVFKFLGTDRAER